MRHLCDGAGPPRKTATKRFLLTVCNYVLLVGAKKRSCIACPSCSNPCNAWYLLPRLTREKPSVPLLLLLPTQCWYINNCCGAANLRHFLLFLFYIQAVSRAEMCPHNSIQLGDSEQSIAAAHRPPCSAGFHIEAAAVSEPAPARLKGAPSALKPLTV